MTEELMSDERQDQLLKAAEETISLMNIGVEPNAALSKIAKDNGMNDHEVSVVAHAVNNGRQLAHLQNSKGDEREHEFPLINPEEVNPNAPVQPATNAEQRTGYRYGVPDTPGVDIEAKIDAPDADETQEELRKAASATLVDEDDYRLQTDQPDYAAMLREGWGLGAEQQVKVAEYESTVPFAKLSHYRIAIENEGLEYLQKVEGCTDAMKKVAHSMRLMDAPPWQEVEKAASQMGVDQPTLDLIYANCDIEKFGEQRADLSKIASEETSIVSQKVYDLATECVRANTFWKEAADAAARKEALLQGQAAEEAALFPKEAASGAANTPLGIQTNVSASLGELAEPIEKAPEEFTGLTPEVIQQAFGASGEPSEKGPQAPGYDFRQEMTNIRARDTVENLMEDDYIGGHSLPEVVEAYNSAMSVNPNFGRAELISYIRQHLATQGGVPLDLQIRARPKGQGGSRGEES